MTKLDTKLNIIEDLISLCRRYSFSDEFISELEDALKENQDLLPIALEILEKSKSEEQEETEECEEKELPFTD